MLVNTDSNDDQIDDKIWEIIAQNNYLDELSSLKFFVQLQHSIDQDVTFQLVLNKVRALVDNVEHLSFKEALDTIIEKK